MWKLKSIRIKNLFSHKDTRYDFINDELTVVLGINHDRKNKVSDELTSGNSCASGKSSLLEGIVLSLTGEVWKKVGKDDFIMNGENDCETDLVLFNTVLDREMKIFLQGQ